MRFYAATALAAVLFQGTIASLEPVERAAAPADGSSAITEPAYYMEAEPAFEKRQGVGGGQQAATTEITYPGTITTQWLPVNTKIGGVETETWLPYIYTQTFAQVPDQFPSPGSGAIGYGTLTKSKGKRWAEAEPTPAPDAKATGVAGHVPSRLATATVYEQIVHNVVVVEAEVVQVQRVVRPVTVLSIVTPETVYRYLPADPDYAPLTNTTYTL